MRYNGGVVNHITLSKGTKMIMLHLWFMMDTLVEKDLIEYVDCVFGNDFQEDCRFEFFTT